MADLLTHYPPNRYAGTCRTCHTEVLAGEGRIRHGATGWIIAHLTNLCPDPPAVIVRTDVTTYPATDLDPAIASALAELHLTPITTRPRGADGRFTKL